MERMSESREFIKEKITVYCTHCGTSQDGYRTINTKAWAQMGGLVCFYCKKLFFWEFTNERRRDKESKVSLH